MSNVGSMKPSAIADGVAVATKGAAMTAAEIKLAKSDIKHSVGAKLARRELIAGFKLAGRTLADMSKPDKEACQAFWIDLNKLSFEAVGAKMSNKGHPDGKKYNIMALIEGNPADQPDWVMAKQYGAKGDRTLRQYWQSQIGTWVKEVRASWEAMEKAEKALTATPDERTRAFNVIKLEQLDKVKSSVQKQTETTFCPTTFVKQIDSLMALIADSDDTITLDVAE